MMCGAHQEYRVALYCQLPCPCRGVALQQLFGVTMLRLPGPPVYSRGGPILFLVGGSINMPLTLSVFAHHSFCVCTQSHVLSLSLYPEGSILISCDAGRAIIGLGRTSTWTWWLRMAMRRC